MRCCLISSAISRARAEVLSGWYCAPVSLLRSTAVIISLALGALNLHTGRPRGLLQVWADEDVPWTAGTPLTFRHTWALLRSCFLHCMMLMLRWLLPCRACCRKRSQQRFSVAAVQRLLHKTCVVTYVMIAPKACKHKAMNAAAVPDVANGAKSDDRRVHAVPASTVAYAFIGRLLPIKTPACHLRVTAVKRKTLSPCSSACQPRSALSPNMLAYASCVHMHVTRTWPICLAQPVAPTNQPVDPCVLPAGTQRTAASTRTYTVSRSLLFCCTQEAHGKIVALPCTQ